MTARNWLVVLLSLVSTSCGLAGPENSTPPARPKASTAQELTFDDGVEPTQPAGTLEGDTLQVGAGGGVSYTLPLRVPQGRLGIEPSLAIVYGGQSNGQLGVGFGLSGLSKITRCHRDMAHDGEPAAITVDTKDAFCLDGKRLIPLTPKGKGEVVTEFRPENDPFRRVKITEEGPDGPTRFEATDRDGRVARYEAAMAQRVRPSDDDGTIVFTTAPLPWVWPIATLTDLAGNYSKYEWTSAVGTEPTRPFDLRPRSIQYTGSTAEEGGRQVRFIYESRPDPVEHWVAGVLTRETQRLSEIETYAPGSKGAPALVHRYSLSYRNDSVTKRSLLFRVQGCDGRGGCLPPTHFEWERGGFELDLTGQSLPYGARFVSLSTADFNGDGRGDILTSGTSSSGGPTAWSVYLSDGVRVTLKTTQTTLGTGCFASDVDRDGSAELLCRDTVTGWNLYRWTSTGFLLDQVLGGVSTLDRSAWLADLDGDGAVDFVTSTATSPTSPYLAIRRNLRTGSTVFGPLITTSLSSRYASRGAASFSFDPQGDGRIDFTYATADGFPTPSPMIAMSLKVGSDAPQIELLNAKNSSIDQLFLDVNGDGLKDQFEPGKGQVRKNTGNGFGPVEVLPGAEGDLTPAQLVPASWWWLQDTCMRVLDFDGDGQHDLMVLSGSGVGASPPVIYLSRGHELNRVPLTLPRYTQGGSWPMVTLDLNGDGQQDIAYLVGDEETWGASAPPSFKLWLARRKDARADRLITVTNGLGRKDRIEYGTLTQGELYTPGSGCIWPQRCLKPSGMEVVAAMVRDDGSGRDDRTEYSYEDARSDVTGPGFVGFSRVTRHRLTDGEVVESLYDNRTRIGAQYPFASRAREVTGAIRSDATHLYGRNTHQTNAVITAETSKIVWPYTSVSSSRQFELLSSDQPWHRIGNVAQLFVSAAPLRERVTTRTLDAYGNTTLLRDSTVSGTTREVATTYANDETRWVLGEVQRVEVRHSAAAVPTLTTTTTFDHDLRGLLTKETREPDDASLRLVTELTRGAADGRVEKVCESDGTSTRCLEVQYDAEGIFPRLVTNALGHVTEVLRAPGLGSVVGIAGPNGAVRQFRVDGFGRPRALESDDGRSLELTYEARGLGGFRAIQTSGDGQSRSFEFDRIGHLKRTARLGFDGRWVVTDREYDNLGLLRRETLPAFVGEAQYWTNHAYDGLRRRVRTELPGGDVATASYLGLTAHLCEKTGHCRWETTNADGRLTRVEDGPARIITAFAYDAAGHVISTTAAGVVSTSTWDRLGRRIGIVDADAGGRAFGWNAFGELVSETDALGVTTFHRDALGRVFKEQRPDGSDLYQWDTAVRPSGGFVLGALRSATSADGISETLDYDDLGRITRSRTTVGGEAFDLEVEFDALGRASVLRYPNDGLGRFSVERYWNAQGYLSSVTDGTGTALWELRTMTAAGKPLAELFGNGVLSSRAYDALSGRLQRLMAVHSDATSTNVLQDLRFLYDGSGRISERLDPVANRDEEYSYDSLDRLTSWQVTTNSSAERETYGYDTRGNIVSTIGFGETHAFTYGGTAGPHALITDNGDPFSYDALGRQITAPTRSVQYTSFDLPRRIVAPTGATEYRYAPGGLRVLEDGPAGKTIRIKGIYERQVAGGVTTHQYFVTGSAGIAAIIRRGPTVPEERKYVHLDQLGSPSVVTNAAGAVIERSYFAPYGKRVNREGFGMTAPTYSGRAMTGHEDDVDGLVDMGARLYDPTIRRFLTPDPLIGNPRHSQSFARYAYVENSPTRFIDPTGRDGEPADNDNTDGNYDYHDEDGTGFYNFPDDEVYGSGGQGSEGESVAHDDSLGGTNDNDNDNDRDVLSFDADDVYGGYDDLDSGDVDGDQSGYEVGGDPGDCDSEWGLAVSTYEYNLSFELGPAGPEATPELAMNLLQSNPNAFFPFQVVPTGAHPRAIELHRTYDLRGARGGGTELDRGAYVTVSELTPTSFTFTTLPGHFDLPGSTITFTVVESGGSLYLQQTAHAWTDIISATFACDFAPGTWQIQAQRLSDALYDDQ